MNSKEFGGETVNRHHVTIKLLAIGLLVVLLLIPMTMIKKSIWEREGRRTTAERDITSIWGGTQIIGGPVLTVPYTAIHNSGKENEYKMQHYAHFFPEELNISSKVSSQIRYRGIFEIPVYITEAAFSGSFLQPDFSEFGNEGLEITWDKAFLTLKISDLTGVKGGIPVEWNSEKRNFKSGVYKASFLLSGANAPVTLKGDADKKESYSFKISLKIAGSNELKFIPLGRVTKLDMASEWPSPSFTGAYLPDDRHITDNGFSAQWNIMDIGRNYGQKGIDSEINLSALNNSAMGVEFIIPTDHYKLSTRSAKYAILFIGLTFLVFFVFEIFSKLKIHPLQYLLVGFANCIFYLLLIAISEHFNFYIAYLVGSISVVLVISGYCWSILKHLGKASSIAGLQGLLYGYLFILLQSEDYSFLFGSLGLFTILAAFMFFTRKVNWYVIGNTVLEKKEKHASGTLEV